MRPVLLAVAALLAGCGSTSTLKLHELAKKDLYESRWEKERIALGGGRYVPFPTETGITLVVINDSPRTEFDPLRSYDDTPITGTHLYFYFPTLYSRTQAIPGGIGRSINIRPRDLAWGEIRFAATHYKGHRGTDGHERGKVWTSVGAIQISRDAFRKSLGRGEKVVMVVRFPSHQGFDYFAVGFRRGENPGSKNVNVRVHGSTESKTMTADQALQEIHANRSPFSGVNLDRPNAEMNSIRAVFQKAGLWK